MASSRPRQSGGWARGTASRRSDVDLLVIGLEHCCVLDAYDAANSHEPGEPSPDRDLRSHSLTGLLDKLYAPTRFPDAIGDELTADMFGPEDAAAALEAATALLDWAGGQLS